MPCLTQNQYIQYRQWLRELWLEHRDAFAQIPPADQRLLHDYFEPSIQCTPAEAQELRKARAKQDRTLPQQAGRALHRLEQILAGELVWQPAVALSKPQGRQKPRAISVRSVLVPHPDAQRFARAVLDFHARLQTSPSESSRVSSLATRSEAAARPRGPVAPSE